MRRERNGFTLTEMLVALAIVAVLAGIAVPVTLGVKRRAQRTACLANLREIGMTLESYLQDHGEVFPEWPAGLSSKTGEGPSMDRDLVAYGASAEIFHCPADHVQFERSGDSYVWNTTQNGRRRDSLAFFATGGEARKIPLVSDKEGWHSGPVSVNFLYADLSAASKVKFDVNE